MAAACEPLPAHLIKDPKIEKQADCSFTEGEYGSIGPLEGGKAINIGNGLVGQRLSNYFDSGLCGIEAQELFLMNCTTGEDLVFEGAPLNGDPYNQGREIASIQHPKGPLRLGPDATLEQLASVARRSGIEYKTNSIRARAKAIKRKNRFDPSCGCKLFYPGSVGATQ